MVGIEDYLLTYFLAVTFTYRSSCRVNQKRSATRQSTVPAQERLEGKNSHCHRVCLVGILKEGHTAQGGRGAHMIHELYRDSETESKGCRTNMSQNKSRVAVAPVS
jgi:hypothetical protein